MDIARETSAAYAAFAGGRHAEAAELAARVLRQAPDDPGASTLVGRLALTRGEPETARQVFQRVLDQHPSVAAVWLDLALALRDLGHTDAAVAATERALALDGRLADAWVRLGELQLSVDRRGEAARAFRRALKLRPDDAGACRGMVLAEEPGPRSTLVKRMENLAATAQAPRTAAELHYALAQVYRRAGDDAAFVRHLLAANARQRSLCADGRNVYAEVFDRLEAAFTPEALARSRRAAPVMPTPIFVLGMPRSGTTLVERLLAGHPEVADAGELDYVRGPLRRQWEARFGGRFPEGFDGVSAADLTELAGGFADRLRLAASGAPWVVDKTPGNYHVVGLLRLLFPDGKIVHVARDPMDTCFSILQQPFDDRSPHTCDQALLGYVYGRYRRLMAHWQRLLGDQVLTVRYEDLVADPSVEGQRLFAYCGLQWDDAYLAFHERGDTVRTFSATQVRRPIHQSSVGAWQRYAGALAPLRQALDEALA